MPGTAPSHFRYDVFLSHSHADKPVVRELAERLQEAGLRVWLDEWILHPGESVSDPGDPIATAEKEGLEHAAVLVFCMSAHAFGADWNRLHSHFVLFSGFLNRDRRFVPLRLDDAPIQPRLDGYAWIDWRPNANRAEEWSRLLAACRPAEAPAPGGAATDPLRALDLFHPGRVVGVAWSLDGQRLASVGWCRKVALWKEASGGGLEVIQNENRLGHEWSSPYWSELVFCVGWSADRQRLASSDNYQVLIREVASGRILAVLESNSLLDLVCLGWSPDGQRLASGNDYGSVRVWEVASGRELAAFLVDEGDGHVRSVAWSPDGRLLASAMDDDPIRVWEVASGRELALLDGHNGSVWSVRWSPDGQRLASAGDGTVRVWEVASGRELVVIEGHGGAVNCVEWSADGQQLASGGEDRTIRVWDAATGRGQAVLEGHGGPVSSIDWNPDGQRLTSAGEDGTVRLWDVLSGRALAVVEGQRERVDCVAWSPDGQWLASGGGMDSKGMYPIRVWDGASGRALAVLQGHLRWVNSLCWSPDGQRLASGDEEGTVRVWEVASGRVLAVLGYQRPAFTAESLEELQKLRQNREVRSVRSVCWSPDGQRLAGGGGFDGVVRVWEAESGRELAVLPGHSRVVESVCWSPDGQWLASGGEEGTVRIWDAASGLERVVLAGHGGAVHCVAWSPDGQRLASGGMDGRVRVWEASSGRALAVLEDPKGQVRSLAWSPDGQWLASGGDDRVVRVGEAASGRALVALQGHKGRLRNVGWGPARQGAAGAAVLWSADEYGAVLLWQTETLESQPAARGAKARASSGTPDKDAHSEPGCPS